MGVGSDLLQVPLAGQRGDLLGNVSLRASTRRGYAAQAALHRIHATLRAALNGAVRTRLIPVKPGRWPELPKAARPRPQVWTAGVL